MTPPALSELAALLASWMTISALVTGSLLGVALAVQRLLRGAVPHRLVWSVALGASAVLTATQPWRRSGDRPSLTATAVAAVGSGISEQPPTRSPLQRAASLLRGAPLLASEVLTGVGTRAAAMVRAAPRPAQWLVVTAWPLATLILFGIGASSYRRQRRLVMRAQAATIAGQQVFVTASTGPAVIGVRTPRIIVPAWLSTRSAFEQRLVVQHEQAHIEANDPQLLLSACVLAALMPWNPSVWYMLSRLRLAIELDCDARVLQSGTMPRHYGALLIDLSAAARPLPPLTGAPAFSHHASHLERRLRRMTDRPTTYRVPRRLAGFAIASAALLAACGAELPTSAELEGMDVATATRKLSTVAPSTKRQFYIDGRAATEGEALAIPANLLASIEVTKTKDGAQALRLTTRTSSSPAAPGTTSSPLVVAGITTDSVPTNESPLVTMRITQIDSTSRALRIADTAAKLSFSASGAPQPGDTTRAVAIGDRMAFLPARKTSDVLILVDGVKATEDAMRMPPDRIERIEVIKGAAAEKIYGPEGAKGVIVITTKK